MSSIERREYFIDEPQLPKLFLQSWQNTNKETVGCALITHGLAEHSECYSHVAEALANNGWMVFAWDMQGHGRSEGKRGYIYNFKEYPRDLKTIIEKVKENGSIKTNPFVLIGHSMGGLVTLSALAENNISGVSRAVLSSPALGISAEVPKIKEMASKWLNNFWPTLTMNNELRYHVLSRDPEMVSSYSKDPLRHTKISAPLYLGMVAEMEEVLQKGDLIKTPVYFQLAGKDQIVDTQKSLDLYKMMSCEKKLDLYEESFHEIYNDLNKKETIDDLARYLGELIP